MEKSYRVRNDELDQQLARASKRTRRGQARITYAEHRRVAQECSQRRRGVGDRNARPPPCPLTASRADTIAHATKRVIDERWEEDPTFYKRFSELIRQAIEDFRAKRRPLQTMKCPSFSNTFVFADDAKLAAQLCCALSVAGIYQPVCDGPRMMRPDRKLEVLCRLNAMTLTRANTAFMAGLPNEAFDALRASLTPGRSVTCQL